MLEKILISSCLLGEKVRFDGQGKLIDHPAIKKWQQENRLVAFCPEVSGGLSTPRPPAEIQANLIVMTSTGEDVTAQFKHGAELTLKLCQKHQIKFALMKAKSPSCGNNQRYNGSFDGTLVKGSGLAAEALIKNGIQVFNENQVDELAKCIHAAELSIQS